MISAENVSTCFCRSEKVNSKMPAEIADAISMQQFRTSAFSNISVADVLAARKDLALINKVNNLEFSFKFLRSCSY